MTNLTPMEFQGERILTTEQLAQIYETEVNNIKNNFANNKGNFIEGRHYFLLQGENLKTFKSQVNNFDQPLEVSKFASQLYLWTKRGASRHCKMLGTDKAWEQFDVLEESYFTPTMQLLSPQLQLLIGIELKQKAIESRQDKQEAVLDSIRDVVVVRPNQQREWINSTINKIVSIRGG